MTIDPKIQGSFVGIIGKSCCRQRVGDYRYFSAGFGKQVPNEKASKNVVPFYGEWEIGSYTSTWRIIRDGNVVCSGRDLVDSDDELNKRLQGITLGTVVAVEMLSKFEVRVSLDNGILLDFICLSGDYDEVFHVFAPEHIFIRYSLMNGWEVRKSNVPNSNDNSTV